MQSSKLIKLKKKLVLSGVYALLSAILILSISTAKYADVRVAYSSYGAASFNSVILGDCTNGTLTAFGKTLNANNCVPGMTYTDSDLTNTAKVIPFCIANGISSDNASEASVSYTVCLRTTKNLPLRFKLAKLGADDEEGITFYEAGEPVQVENNDESGKGSELVWYEWKFYAASGDSEESNGEESEQTEAIFSLKGGSLSRIDHQLIIEWPIENEEEVKDNSTYYMKEIDLMEVLVTVSSKNSISDSYEEITYSAGDLYGKGIIILNPNMESDSSDATYPYHYSYPIDLRAFHEITDGSEIMEGSSEESSKIYEFSVTNGAGFAIEQQKMYTDYVLELKTPYTVEIPDSTVQATKDFTYKLFVLAEAGEGIYKYKEVEPVGSPEYRLYYEDYSVGENGERKYGTYRTPTETELGNSENLVKWTKEDSPERLYVIYRYETFDNGKTFRLENKTVDSSTGTYVDRAATTDFRLMLITPEDIDVNVETAFENKLELFAKARHIGDVPTVVPDAGDDTDDEDSQGTEPNAEESENNGGGVE